MKRYILKHQSKVGSPKDWPSQSYPERKAFDILTGIALGILADGELSAKEASFLARWLEANSNALPEQFIRKLLPVIRIAGRGEDISDEGLSSITTLLESIIESGNQPESSMVASALIGTPCALIFDLVDFQGFKISDCELIFTGNFSGGSKKELMDRSICLGALAKSANPTRQTDYVVVGSKGSDQWAYSGLGRKVEHALKLKGESCKLRIIREEDFVRALERIENLSAGH